MATVLLSYSTPSFRLSQRLLCLSARLCGVNRCLSKTRKDLEQTAFYAQYRHILDQPRGGGYWLWKPYYILETLKQLAEGDILIYADSAVLLWKKPGEVIKHVRENGGLGLFYNAKKVSEYTKRDLLLAMHCDEPRYYDAPQIHANFMIFERNARTLAFLEEVMHYATLRELITDAPNAPGIENLPDFIDHRHDQAIFSLAMHKNSYTVLADATQFRIKPAHFNINRGDIFPAQLGYRSVAFVHRYKNRQLWKLAGDILRKFMRLSQ
ncbi:MAG: hypothetical protein MUC87_20375 [Bacteroidia bacterium]|jgi:hypothetical protein|nr:hypothetical protein [Bacteroidia bacterium]